MIRYTTPEGYFENLSERIKKRHRKQKLRRTGIAIAVALILIISIPSVLELGFSRPENSQQALEEYILDEVETELVIETLAFNH